MLVVRGITNEGKKFRPSDWAEMLVGHYTHACTHLAFATDAHSIEERKACISISRYITICCTPHYCEVHVNSELKDIHPLAYQHVRSFAILNNLQFTEPELGGDFNEEQIV